MKHVLSNKMHNIRIMSEVIWWINTSTQMIVKLEDEWLMILKIEKGSGSKKNLKNQDNYVMFI